MEDLYLKIKDTDSYFKIETLFTLVSLSGLSSTPYGSKGVSRKVEKD